MPTQNSDTQNSDIFQNSDTLFASTKKIHWFFLNSELKIEPSQFLKTFIVNFIMSRQYLNRYFRRRWIFKLTDLPTMLSNFWLHLMNNFENIKNFLGHSIFGIIGKVSRRSATFLISRVFQVRRHWEPWPNGATESLEGKPPARAKISQIFFKTPRRQMRKVTPKRPIGRPIRWKRYPRLLRLSPYWFGTFYKVFLYFSQFFC